MVAVFAAESATEPTGPQVVLIVVGVLLAVASAVITNLVLVARGRRLASLSDEIDELEEWIQDARRALDSSILQQAIGRVLMGLIETPSLQLSTDAFRAYFYSATQRYAQAGFTMAGWLEDQVDPPESESQVRPVRRIAEALEATQRQGPEAVGDLINAMEKVRNALLKRISHALNWNSIVSIMKGSPRRYRKRAQAYRSSASSRSRQRI